MSWLYQHPEPEPERAIYLAVPRRNAGDYVVLWWQNEIFVKCKLESSGYAFYEFKNDQEMVKAYDLGFLAIPIDQHGNGVDLDKLSRKQPVKGAS